MYRRTTRKLPGVSAAPPMVTARARAAGVFPCVDALTAPPPTAARAALRAGAHGAGAGGDRAAGMESGAGVRVRQRVGRQEGATGTELLVCELLPSQHRLTARGETVVSFTPTAPGRYAFTCGMGMYSGLLIVHPTSGRSLGAGPSGSQWRGPTSSSDRSIGGT